MFNITDVKIENAFEPLEAGWYGGHISTLEWKESAKGARYINAQIKLDNNRVVFAMYHVFNSNEVARNIALADIKKALLASGCAEDKLNFASEDALMEAMATVNCEIYLKVQKSSEYGDKNVVGNYQKRTEAAATINTDSIPF